MRELFENALSTVFPPERYVIQTAEEAKEWFRFEVPNHSKLDPFRPLGPWDSWAGNVKGGPIEASIEGYGRKRKTKRDRS